MCVFCQKVCKSQIKRGLECNITLLLIITKKYFFFHIEKKTFLYRKSPIYCSLA